MAPLDCEEVLLAGFGASAGETLEDEGVSVEESDAATGAEGEGEGEGAACLLPVEFWSIQIESTEPSSADLAVKLPLSAAATDRPKNAPRILFCDLLVEGILIENSLG